LAGGEAVPETVRAPSAVITTEGERMLADQFQTAAAAAKNTHAVDELARLTWRAHGEGQIGDIDAAAIGEALQRRRASLAMSAYPRPAMAAHARRCEPRSPDRRASLERRRRQAMSGIVPARLAAHFTPGELAVLSVIGRQCQKRGACSLPIDALAALAGVCRTVVKNALRQARAVGLVLVKERRIPGRKSLTNVITAIGDWSAWLRRGGIGVRNMTSSIESVFNSESLPRQRGLSEGRKRKDHARLKPSSTMRGA
jgi:hypothetical protein